jgi:hypothetical protein
MRDMTAGTGFMARRRRPAWIGKILVCAAAGALGLACGMDAAPDEAEASSELSCATVSAGGGWWNQGFPEETGRFHVELDATPSTSAIDAVVGLGNGSASRFDQLGAIVRFNATGTIDARAGSIYRADVTQPYQAGTTYHLRLDVDVRTHTYSVWLRNYYGSYDAIARDYPFRTEQVAVTHLNDVASEVDAATGTLQICGVQVVADATTADGCWIAAAGDGFVTAPLPDATVLETLTFTATASAPSIDGVIGLSAGAAASFSDLATAVRFAPSGVIDVRDGDVYRSDASWTYRTAAVLVRVIADLTSHTYSVFQGDLRFAQELARQYRFRTSQRGVTHLDHLAAIVDGTAGSLKICQVSGQRSTGVAFSQEGNYEVAPLAGDQALVSDGATTRRLDPGGRTLAQVARGGALAVDLIGNVFIASVADTTLSVDKYDPSFGARCHVTLPVLAGATITAMASDPTGAVLVGVVTRQDGRVTVTRFTAGCAFASQLAVSGEAVVIDGGQPIVAWNDSGTLRITRYTASGATVWARAFAGTAAITAMAVDPSHQVLFGGELYTAMDFGGGTLPLRSNPDGEQMNGFVVKLSTTGAHVFSRRTEYSWVGGIASNGPRVVVSGTEQTQFHYRHFQVFDAAGAPVATTFDPGLQTFSEDHGYGGRVAIAASGRVWWNLETQWPLFPSWKYFVSLTL